MDLNTKLAVLDRIYSIYDDFAETLDIACRRHCAHCCTRNVTMTALEAYRLAEYLMSNNKTDLFRVLESQASERRFQPLASTNRLAAICMRGGEPPREENDASWGDCPFLGDAECPVYAARPFGCRCFVSKQECGQAGYADVDPFVLTVNNVFLQYIEHVDEEGCSGNFTDMLLFMASEKNRLRYAAGNLGHPEAPLIPNQPIPVLMVPPEHQARIRPIINEIRRIRLM